MSKFSRLQRLLGGQTTQLLMNNSEWNNHWGKKTEDNQTYFDAEAISVSFFAGFSNRWGKSIIILSEQKSR